MIDQKRICLLTHSIFSYGGVQRVTAVLAKELAKEYDVTIVTFDKASAEDRTLYGLDESHISYRFFQYPSAGYFKWRFCKIYSFLYRYVLPQTPLTARGYTHSSFPSQKRLALCRELQEGQYDVIIGVHAPLAARLAACRPWLGSIKLIGWIHNSYEALFGKDSTYIGPQLRKYYEYQLQQLDETVVLCNYDAQRYSFPTQVIYNPLTLTPGKPADGTTKRFLAVGRFSYRHKGFDLLIKAFHLFAQEDREWTLDIVGEGPEEPLYRQLISQYHLEDRITIHPFTHQIQDYYSQAQIYVLSSRWEGFGLVLVEAMAHGLPVISSDLPTSQEIMGPEGLYFANGDIQGMARQMKRATQMDWHQQSQQAFQVAKRFNISTIIRQWHQLINKPLYIKTTEP